MSGDYGRSAASYDAGVKSVWAGIRSRSLTAKCKPRPSTPSPPDWTIPASAPNTPGSRRGWPCTVSADHRRRGDGGLPVALTHRGNRNHLVRSGYHGYFLGVRKCRDRHWARSVSLDPGNTGKQLLQNRSVAVEPWRASFMSALPHGGDFAAGHHDADRRRRV